MEYKLKVGDELVPVRAELSSGDELALTLDGREMRVRFQRMSEHRLLLTVRDGTRESSVDAYLCRSGNGNEVVIRGVPHRILDADIEERTVARKRAGDRIPDTVTPPMPATVVKVLVEEGQKVEKGQAVVVVSAMKMETTLRAPHDGTVRKVRTAAGEKVSPGDLLLDIEKDPAT